MFHLDPPPNSITRIEVSLCQGGVTFSVHKSDDFEKGLVGDKVLLEQRYIIGKTYVEDELKGLHYVTVEVEESYKFGNSTSDYIIKVSYREKKPFENLAFYHPGQNGVIEYEYQQQTSAENEKERKVLLNWD